MDVLKLKIKKPTAAPKTRVKASTNDILGPANGRPQVHVKWMEHHNHLTQLQSQLLNDQRTLAEDAREATATYSEHMADAATDSYDRDWALSMLSSEQNAIYEIQQALNRIVNGTYGICELSGRPIESERLKTIPWTRFSAEAQHELENKGAMRRTQLGELGTYFKSSDLDESAEEEVAETPAVTT
jgi:RNA polymerase-binding transcription factor DksA